LSKGFRVPCRRGRVIRDADDYKEHTDSACPLCYGSGTVRDPDRDCPNCNGDGIVLNTHRKPKPIGKA